MLWFIPDMEEMKVPCLRDLFINVFINNLKKLDTRTFFRDLYSNLTRMEKKYTSQVIIQVSKKTVEKKDT